MSENPLRKPLVTRIEQLMSKQELSQAQLAKKADISASALSLILAKKRTPTAEVLQRLASALHTTVDYLLGRASEAELDALLQNEEIFALCNDFRELRDSDRQTVLRMVRAMKSDS